MPIVGGRRRVEMDDTVQGASRNRKRTLRDRISQSGDQGRPPPQRRRTQARWRAQPGEANVPTLNPRKRVALMMATRLDSGGSGRPIGEPPPALTTAIQPASQQGQKTGEHAPPRQPLDHAASAARALMPPRLRGLMGTPHPSHYHPDDTRSRRPGRQMRVPIPERRRMGPAAGPPVAPILPSIAPVHLTTDLQRQEEPWIATLQEEGGVFGLSREQDGSATGRTNTPRRHPENFDRSEKCHFGENGGLDGT